MFGGKFRPKGKTALIVGASQGLGAKLALMLHQQECNVTLVARTESKLVQQVQDIRDADVSANDASINYIPCDVSNYHACEQLWNTLKNDWSQDPDFIFCCAGSSIPKLFGDLTGKELQLGVTTNYNTALNVVHTGFKAFNDYTSPPSELAFKSRHIILVSSVTSFFPFIGYSQYAPMKAAILSLSVILRQELGPFGYRVSCVFPGNFQLEGFDEEQKTKPQITKLIEGPSLPISAELCASMIFSQLDRGYDTITTDTIGWLLGSTVLGVLPRSWGILQVIVSFVFSIIAPIVNLVIYRDILLFFETHAEQPAKDGHKKADVMVSEVTLSDDDESE